MPCVWKDISPEYVLLCSSCLSVWLSVLNCLFVLEAFCSILCLRELLYEPFRLQRALIAILQDVVCIALIQVVSQ